MRLQDRDVQAPLDIFRRTYHSLLRSSGEIQIQALVEPYLAFEPALHHGGDDTRPDLDALTYSSLRLPSCIDSVRLVLLGQSHEVFDRSGRADVTSWQPVSAPGRRRKMFWDGNETLAVLIASPSDVDDLVPMLVAFQIEWNKLHALLEGAPAEWSAPAADQQLAGLGLEESDIARLRALWGAELGQKLDRIAGRRKRLAVRMLGGSLMDYERATLRWWWHIEDSLPQLPLRDRPVYFVSSNTHSLINILSGFALRNTGELLEFIQQRELGGLLAEYRRIAAEQEPSSIENFWYYAQKKYQADGASAEYFRRRASEEAELGMHRVASRFYLDIDAQLIELCRLDPGRMDPRIVVPGIERLRESRAVVINIDYPLGLAAYHIFKIMARSVGRLRGAYVLGKAATLNGKVGDVLIPNLVFDEHTGNTFHFAPVFSAIDVEPYLVHGSVLDNQKSVTSLGTFLQNERFLDALYREFFTDIEMEAGPYLNAIYEHLFAARYPNNDTVSFLRAPFDFSFLHYASDTPYSKGSNLGSRNLSYFGMDPTYAASLAIGRRILAQEVERVGE